MVDQGIGNLLRRLWVFTRSDAKASGPIVIRMSLDLKKEKRSRRSSEYARRRCAKLVNSKGTCGRSELKELELACQEEGHWAAPRVRPMTVPKKQREPLLDRWLKSGGQEAELGDSHAVWQSNPGVGRDRSRPVDVKEARLQHARYSDPVAAAVQLARSTN